MKRVAAFLILGFMVAGAITGCRAAVDVDPKGQTSIGF
jgi:hypothetical protein